MLDVQRFPQTVLGLAILWCVAWQHDLSSENAEIARRLSQLLERHRTEGHSRSGTDDSQ
jgi:hypothetical protein